MSKAEKKRRRSSLKRLQKESPAMFYGKRLILTKRAIQKLENSKTLKPYEVSKLSMLRMHQSGLEKIIARIKAKQPKS